MVKWIKFVIVVIHLYDPSIKHITCIRNPGLLEEATDSLSMTSYPKKSCYCKWKRIFIRWCYYGSCFKSNDTSDYEKLELYQRLDKAKTMSELNSLKAEFDDYYGIYQKLF